MPRGIAYRGSETRSSADKHNVTTPRSSAKTLYISRGMTWHFFGNDLFSLSKHIMSLCMSLQPPLLTRLPLSSLSISRLCVFLIHGSTSCTLQKLMLIYSKGVALTCAHVLQTDNHSPSPCVGGGGGGRGHGWHAMCKCLMTITFLSTKRLQHGGDM